MHRLRAFSKAILKGEREQERQEGATSKSGAVRNATKMGEHQPIEALYSTEHTRRTEFVSDEWKKNGWTYFLTEYGDYEAARVFLPRWFPVWTKKFGKVGVKHTAVLNISPSPSSASIVNLKRNDASFASSASLVSLGSDFEEQLEDLRFFGRRLGSKESPSAGWDGLLGPQDDGPDVGGAMSPLVGGGGAGGFSFLNSTRALAPGLAAARGLTRTGSADSMASGSISINDGEMVRFEDDEDSYIAAAPGAGAGAEEQAPNRRAAGVPAAGDGLSPQSHEQLVPPPQLHGPSQIDLQEPSYVDCLETYHGIIPTLEDENDLRGSYGNPGYITVNPFGLFACGGWHFKRVVKIVEDSFTQGYQYTTATGAAGASQHHLFGPRDVLTESELAQVPDLYLPGVEVDPWRKLGPEQDGTTAAPASGSGSLGESEHGRERYDRTSW
eukprot:g6168.t1